MDMVMKHHQLPFQLLEGEVIYKNRFIYNIKILILILILQLHLMVQEKPEVLLEDLVQDMPRIKLFSTSVSPNFSVCLYVFVYTLYNDIFFFYINK